MSLAEFTLFLGVIFYLIGFPTILADEKMFHWRKKLLHDDVRIRLLGGLMVAFAVLVLAKEYWVDFTIRGFMTFIVWLTLVKGLVYAWWPSKLQELSSWTEHKIFLDAPSRITLGVLQISMAALFTYWGFFVL